jgi:hypothetical protein
MKKPLLILLCSTILFSGCITTKLNKTVEACETADCIQMNYGPPTHIQKNGEFGEVWTYGGSTNEDTNSGVKQETNVYINSTGYKDKTATMRIFIDKNNKVYKREIKHSKKYNYFYTTLSFTATAIGAPILIIGLVQLLNGTL